MVLRVHGFELGVHVTWFRQYGAPSFESTGYIVRQCRSAGYAVSHYP